MKITLRELKKLIRSTITESTQNASQVAANGFIEVFKSQEVKETWGLLSQMARGGSLDPQSVQKVKVVVGKLSDALEGLHNSLSQRTDFFGADSEGVPTEHPGHDVRPVDNTRLQH